MPLKVGIVGVTGMVGEEFIKLMTEEQFRVSELRPFASEQSLGKFIKYQKQEWPIQVLKDNCFEGLDLVFFSSGDHISREWAPKAVEQGAFAIDNSSAFRMGEFTPLVVPEVNKDLIPHKSKPTLIANPNCSTIQLVVALKPLADMFGLSRVTVSTYQAVSGGGKAALSELTQQSKDIALGNTPSEPKNFPHEMAFNCIPEIGDFDKNGYCSEEVKIINETKKILGLPQLNVSAFTVRVPSLNGHCEAVWVTLNESVTRDEVLASFESAEGIIVQDDPATHTYPTVKTASGRNPVYVGRVHKDLSQKNTWIFWVVADNIRKGAALNALQIAQAIFP